MFHGIKKHFALKSYMKKLGPLLKKRYGRSKSYTPGQVKKTIEVEGLNPHYVYYGYAMFCQQEQFLQLATEENSELNLQNLRQEIGDKFFEGDSGFTPEEACQTSIEMNSGIIDFGNDGDGFSGGDCGGIDGGSQ